MIEHHVRIGKMKLGQKGDVLKTVLGSCVGIALIWKRRGLFALAHCLLPEASPQTSHLDPKYVNQAIPLMLSKLGATGEDVLEIEAIVAGGGQMFDIKKKENQFIVGVENLRSAQKILERYRIRVIAFESGGDHGTRIRIDCSTGEYLIERLAKVA